MPKAIQSPGWGQLRPRDNGRKDTRFPDGDPDEPPPPGPSWDLPATISVPQGSFVGIRQYAVNATGAVLNVTGLSGGLSYNAGLERIEATAQSTASVTATFTIDGGVATQRQVSALVLGAEYTLANALVGVPFTVNTPIPPTITSEVTVTPATLAANLVSGRRVTLSAGTYSGFTINTTDQEFILLSGVTVTGTLALGTAAQRIIVRGNPLRANSISNFNLLGEYAGSRTDLLINGLNIPNGTTFINGSASRIAYLNNYIRISDTVSFGGWQQYFDIIWANNELRSEGTGQTGFRYHNPLRMVFVDNLMRKINSEHNPFRIHSGEATPRFVCVRRNQFEGTRLRINPIGDGTAWPSALRIEDVWFEDNDVYRNPQVNVNAFMEANHPNDIIRLTYRNNRHYGSPPLVFRHEDPTARTSDGTAIATWDVSGNSIQPLPGTIPTWSFS